MKGIKNHSRGTKLNKQKDIFLKSEADQWFLRNKDFLLNKEIRSYPLSPIVDLVNCQEKELKVTELGSSIGHNLNYLSKTCKTKLKLIGVEPSKLAIETGIKLYPEIQFFEGTADDLSFLEDESLDVVILGFCLYLVDRNLLSRIVSEIDKKLKSNGKVVIFDFDSKTPQANEYKHFNGVFSYKMDYSQLFLSLPNYCLIEKKSWSHQGDNFTLDKNERCATWVLHKE